MAEETRKFPASWLGVYRGDINNYYGGGHPIKVGGSQSYHSFIGFNSAMKNAIYTSKKAPRVYLSIFTLNAAEFDVGLHKQTSNKGSGSLPFYRYAGIHPYINNGIRYRIDLTNISGSLETMESINTFKEALESGYEGVTLYGGSDYGEAYGVNRGSYEAYIEVEGEWNTPPSKPQVQAPNGGETIVGTNTVSWLPSTDAEQAQSQLRYQVAVYDGVWNYLALTGPGETSLDVNFDQFNDSSVAKIAVRAFDSSIDYSHGDYGAWDYSDGVFTISHNLAPTTPTGLNPAGGKRLDRTQIIQFNWNHNDQDDQSRFEVRWREQGTATWNTISRDTSNEHLYFSASTFSNQNIEWQVRTYDQRQEVSPWSSTAIFFAANQSNKPEIISPSQDASVVESNPTVTWSSVDQAAFNLEVWNGNDVVWSVTKTSTNKAQTILYDLSNETTYQLHLRVKNTDGLWSDFDISDFSTSFTPPEQATLDITTDSIRGAITLGITNPPIQTVGVEKNILYRREFGDIEWTKIADNIPSDFYFTDFTPGSDVVYEYMVETWGDNGTYIRSVPESSQVSLKNTVLSVLKNPDLWVSLKWNPSKSFTHKLERIQMAFNNRKKPVPEFGEIEETSGSASFSIRDKETLDELEEILMSKSLLLLRDNRGRRYFITSDQFDVDDTASGNYEISFRFEAAFVKEDIG